MHTCAFDTPLHVGLANEGGAPHDMSVSEKIRTLAHDGVNTADIARRLGIRYQHAYNVLKADGTRTTSSEAVLVERKNPTDRIPVIGGVSVQYARARGPLVVEGYLFEHVIDLAPLRIDGALRAFMPQRQYANERGLPLNKYGMGPFCKFTAPPSYRKGGVYLLVVGFDSRYVGECANLSARFNNGYGNISPRNCYKDGQETNCRINNLIYTSYAKGETLSLFFHETADYKSIEIRLRAVLCPPWNRV